MKKIAMVTGAGSGIGRASALALVKKGFAVVLCGRNKSSLEGTAARVKDVTQTLVVPADVGDLRSVELLFEATKERFGRLDMLFNNAGINTGNFKLDELPLEEWQRVVNTNLTGAFLCTQQAFKLMKGQQPAGGRIINNGSISASVPRPHSVAYTATKHAITGLTKSTALDGRQYDIACGQIDIGNAATDMTGEMSSGVPQADGSIAPEPTMDLNHVAEAVVYMACLPLSANVLNMTVMATKMPFVGRG